MNPKCLPESHTRIMDSKFEELRMEAPMWMAAVESEEQFESQSTTSWRRQVGCCPHGHFLPPPTVGMVGGPCANCTGAVA